jgi:hypothetical protein
MTDDVNQLFVPDSFRGLYLDARGRLQLSRDALQQRYDLCEDLAQSLHEHCSMLLHRRSTTEDEVLAQVQQGLLQPPSSLPEAEARWVTTRTAELLGWATGALPPQD